MQITLVIPTYNEASCIEEKLANCKYFVEQCIHLGEWRIIVADNGSTDDTRDLAARAGGVEILDLGRIGKYESMRMISNEVASGWIVLTDANVMVRDVYVEELDVLLNNPSAAVLYGLVVRSKKANFPKLRSVKPQRRLLLDQKIGLSSGAYGALYFVRGHLFAEGFRDETIQNDDLYTAVMACNKGRPLIAPVLVEEVEDISFHKEYRRKHRDAIGHVQCLLALAKHCEKRQLAYVLVVRGSIWCGIILFELALIYGLIQNIYIVGPLVCVFSMTRWGGIIIGRCLGFTSGFFWGAFTRPKKTWDTDRS